MSWMNPPWAGGGAKPQSFNPLRNIVPARNTPARGEAQATSMGGRGQAASQARYEGMGRTMSPVTQNLPAPDDGSGDGGGDVYYGQPTPATPAPAMPDVSVESLKKTPEYLARERAIAAAMDLFGANQSTAKTRYEENYGKSLAELGYDPTAKSWDLGELLSSGQRATASGKAYNQLRNDFAARGMLQSGAYQAQRGVLSQQLAEQLTAQESARTRFLEDQATALTAQEQQNEQARQQALAEARQSILDRFSMGG